MKVRITVTVEVDQAAWADVAPCDPDEVRSDMRRYFLNHLQCAAMVEDTEAEVTIR
jgi:hypothetical protein